MKILIIGSTGVLGSRLYSDTIKKKWNALGTFCSHECDGLFYLDVRYRRSIRKLLRLFEPEAVVLAGGITDVDLCEVKPKLARDINIKGTLNLVKEIKEYGSKLAYISTDYVFDGENGPYKETDRANPINTYGKTKLEAENIAMAGIKDCLVVRTSQLYGVDYAMRNFAVKIIRSMRNNKKVYAADDFYSTPTYAGYLSEIIIRLLEKGASGVYNGSGSLFINRYDYVREITDVFNLDKNLIKLVKLKDLKLKAKRPSKGGLTIEKIKKEKIYGEYDLRPGLEFMKKEMAYE